MEIDEDSDPEIETIDLHICQGNIFVWNAQDVKVMRETHHIIGSLVGSLARAPRQNTQMGLPLQLMPEEVNVLLEYGAARIVNVRTHKPNTRDVDKFKNDRQKSFMKQQELWTTRQAQKKQELSHIIEIGRMSRKQRRAEKAMKRRQKQEAAKSKLTKQNASVPNQNISSKLEQEKAKAARLGGVDDSAKRGACEARLGSDNSAMPVQGDCSKLVKDNGPTSTADDDVMKRSLDKQHQHQSHQDTAKKCYNELAGTHNVPQQARSVPPSANDTIKSSVQSGQYSNPDKDNPNAESNAAAEYCQAKISVPKTIEQVPTPCLQQIDQTTCVVDDHCSPQSTPRIESNQCIDSSHQTDKPCSVIENNLAAGVEKSQQRRTDPRQSNAEDNVSTDKELLDQGCLVQIFTGTPNGRGSDYRPVSWKFPKTAQDSLRCRIFRSFWEQGYYITSGSKFGGDFLVYPGDPFLFHSLYVVVCLPYKKSISPLDIVAFGRMASNVKKTVVLCSVDETDEVVYTSVQWTGFS